MRVPVKLIHVVRNPYDSISTMWNIMAKRGTPEELSQTIDRYFSLCPTVEATRAQVEPTSWFDLHHEAFLAHPTEHLRALVNFLGCAAPEDWVAACCGILFDKPRRTREGAGWSPAQVADVAQRLALYPMLQAYSYEDR